MRSEGEIHNTRYAPGCKERIDYTALIAGVIAKFTYALYQLSKFDKKKMFKQTPTATQMESLMKDYLRLAGL